MVRNYILPAAFAVMCAGAVASAQSTATPQQPQTQPPASMDQAATTTVEGCVYREQDIPGHAGNVADRTAAAAGVGDNYVLVASAGSGSGTVGTSGSTGTAGSASASPKIFKLEHSDDSKLSAMVGKRVRVIDIHAHATVPEVDPVVAGTEYAKQGGGRPLGGSGRPAGS